MHFEKEESEVGAMTFYLKRKGLEIFSYQLPWSQRLPFILYWQILRRESLLKFFYWQEALRTEKRKPVVATVGNLTFMPSAFDRRF